MNQIITKGTVLARTNYQEADRILTILTPDQGKVRALAKGVRKSRSKLAAGTELFSISEIGFIHGRGEIATLTTARLTTHFGNIVRDLARTNYAYETMKRLNRITEENVEPAYFNFLKQILEALNDPGVDLELLQLWADVQLLSITGHAPNLRQNAEGKRLEGNHYNFDFDSMAFYQHPDGSFEPTHIKLLRLCATQPVAKLANIRGIGQVTAPCTRLVRALVPLHGL